MISEILQTKAKAMDEVRRLEMIKANVEQQKNIDMKYQVLQLQVHKFVEAFREAYYDADFRLSDSAYNDLANILEGLKSSVESGFANSDDVTEVEKNFKSLNTGVQKEWSKHYQNLTQDKINTLKIIYKIDEGRVWVCLNKISEAKTWTSDEDTIQELKNALDEAQELIQNLKMDREIIDFLIRMNAGKATLVDLNDKVRNWILEEALESKIKLEFKGE